MVVYLYDEGVVLIVASHLLEVDATVVIPVEVYAEADLREHLKLFVGILEEVLV